MTSNRETWCVVGDETYEPMRFIQEILEIIEGDHVNIFLLLCSSSNYIQNDCFLFINQRTWEQHLTHFQTFSATVNADLIDSLAVTR
jgi:hypothetical protein